MSYPIRVRIANDIIAECMAPKHASQKVVILAPGMPGMPQAKKAMHAIAKKGYWVFLPRYRGTWESGGTFLDHSPHEDILDVVDAVSKPMKDIWQDDMFRISNPEVYVIGSSFGGPAAILCSLDPRVRKAVAIAPVVDWRSMRESTAEPMEWLGKKVRDAFGDAYRFSMNDWERLSQGEFYNPIDHIEDIHSEKLMILHAKDDDVVSYVPTVQFAQEVGCQWMSLKKGGHLGSSSLQSWRIGREVWKFLAT